MFLFNKDNYFIRAWQHCGYHLTTSIVAPPLLSLPFAFASLGWMAGIVSLAIGAVVTFYAYNLLSLVLEHHDHLGHRYLTFRDMAYYHIRYAFPSSLYFQLHLE